MSKKSTYRDFWEKVDYGSKIFSVFDDTKAENPIFEYLRNKPKKLIVGDLGCGPGFFLPFLSKHFKRITAIDFSSRLLREAQRRCHKLKNIEYAILDMKNLNSFYNEFNIAISVNSILPETVQDTKKIIKEIYKTIKKGGEFVGILPSADVVIYLALLECNKLISKGVSERKATEGIRKIFEKDRAFNILGFQRDAINQPIQKYFFPFEIKWRFKEAGFKSVELQKVYYSWEYCKNYYYGYFPGYERIWDWFVVAKK